MRFIYNDGGRTAAGYNGRAGDCVARAIAIASGRPYAEVYDALATGTGGERRTKRSGAASGRKTARNGINVRRQWFKDYMRSIGFRWTPTMAIGSGCKVHLVDGELPAGHLVVSVSKHYTAVIDGVIHDTHDPQRDGEIIYSGTPVVDPEDGHMRNPIVWRSGGRCVYGYWSKA